MNNESSNPLRENADKTNIVELRTENTAREKYLAQYDAKITTQEAIVHAILTRSTVVTSALVATVIRLKHVEYQLVA